MVNKVILVGAVVRDAVIRRDRPVPVTHMELMTSHRWKDGAGVAHIARQTFRLVAYARLAEICAERCDLGRRLYIEGRLRTRDLATDGGPPNFRAEVVVETMQIVGRDMSLVGEAEGEPEAQGGTAATSPADSTALVR